MLYKPGDRVLVRDDLEFNRTYFMKDRRAQDTFVRGMDAAFGEVVTIDSITNTGKYHIKEYGMNWVDEMFVGLVDEDDFSGIADIESQVNSLL